MYRSDVGDVGESALARFEATPDRLQSSLDAAWNRRVAELERQQIIRLAELEERIRDEARSTRNDLTFWMVGLWSPVILLLIILIAMMPTSR